MRWIKFSHLTHCRPSFWGFAEPEWANLMQYAFCTSYNLNTFCSNFIFLFWEDNYCDSLWSSSTSDIFLLRHEQEFDMLTNSFDPFWVSWTCREGDQVSVLTLLARVTSVRPFSCENTAAKEHAKHKRAPWTHLPLLYVYLHGQPGIWISFQAWNTGEIYLSCLEEIS